MVESNVNLDLEEDILEESDMEFRTRRSKDPVGRLEVSNGMLFWVPRRRTRKRHSRCSEPRYQRETRWERHSN
ncbi:MAG: hypothetical protein SVY53_05045 [Chloroflexota bacterium]|nr:hypothetical protein [Chloroflexota bacterium]